MFVSAFLRERDAAAPLAAESFYLSSPLTHLIPFWPPQASLGTMVLLLCALIYHLLSEFKQAVVE